MRQTIKPGSLSKRAAALGLKPRRTHDCSQGLNLDPRDSDPPPCLQRNPTIRDFKTLSDLSLSLSWLNGEGILIGRPEQPVWKAGGVNPDVTPVLSVRPPTHPVGKNNNNSGASSVERGPWWATSGGHREGWCTRGLPEGGR